MHYIRSFPVAVALVCLAVSYAQAAEKTSLTIYSTATPGSISPDMYRPLPGGQGGGWMFGNQIPGYAMVHQQREVDLKSGMNEVKFSDVAAYIDPTTVSFKSLTDPVGTSVLEQDYHFDLVSGQKLLERYLDQEVTVDQAAANGAVTDTTGKLLSANGALVLQGKDGKVTSINSYTNIHFPELPGGLITKPTLIWSINTNKPGKHQIDTGYQTTGITWWADYNATYKEGKDENNGFLDLGAWVSIVNKSGADYNNAGLKLVAGDVHRSQANDMMEARKMTMSMAAPAAAPGFAEKAFFEFHLYTLGRSTTIPADSTKQIELFPQVAQVPVEKQYIYYGAPMMGFGGVYTDRDPGTPMNKKVDVYLTLKNDKKYGVGMPLPSGRVRVSKLDAADGSLEFIGEDTIDHTPKDEDVRIKLGSAFDITGERKQTDFRVDSGGHVMEESFEVTLSNHKDGDVNVIVKENMYRTANWQIVRANGQYQKIDANTVYFPVKVKKDQTEKLNYTVRYTW
ncbi:MAG: DUF4139 domain-containing protein [Bdellovibrionales bacterium]